MSDLDLGVLFDQSRSFHARNLDSESGRISSIIPDLYLTACRHLSQSSSTDSLKNVRSLFHAPTNGEK